MLASTLKRSDSAKLKPYQPHGTALQMMQSRAPEVVLSGPAGTGKSRACLEKLHLLAMKYPGMRALIVRKTRESLTESALVTFESHVVVGSDTLLEGPQRRMRQAYHYPNGSEIVIGGLDKPSKIMSTEYDVAYVQEAIEVTEDAWEAITTRLRNGKMPFQQIIADTNPDAPKHWLKRRADAGRTVMLESRHEENPVLYRDGKWTLQGVVYIAKLDALTGPRFHRLRHGRWVQAEGAVYEGWDSAIHLIDRFEIPLEWPRYIAVDFGFTNPFVSQWWAEDPDGRLYRYREIYRTGTLVEDHAKAMIRVMDMEKRDFLRLAKKRWDEIGQKEFIETLPVRRHAASDAELQPILDREWASRMQQAEHAIRPKAVICDHDAEDRATLERHLGMTTVAATKDVSPGIQAVASRLRKAGDGKPRLFLLRDSLDSRDASLAESKKPLCTEEEIDGYIWDLENNRKQGEEPVKKDDHGCDTMRYMVAYKDLAAKKTLQWW